MKKLSLDALLYSVAHLCFLCSISNWARAQETAGDNDALRRGLTWQHNGQVHSILSRGSRYRPPNRRHNGPSRRGNPVVVLSSSNDTAPGESRLSPRVPAASSAAQLRVMTRQHQQPPADRDGDAAPVNREDMMVGDDPYNPYKASNYYPYYNYYNSYYRPRTRTRPRHGYGTSYHQNGTDKPNSYFILHLFDSFFSIAFPNSITESVLSSAALLKVLFNSMLLYDISY